MKRPKTLMITIIYLFILTSVSIPISIILLFEKPKKAIFSIIYSVLVCSAYIIAITVRKRWSQLYVSYSIFLLGSIAFFLGISYLLNQDLLGIGTCIIAISVIFIAFNLQNSKSVNKYYTS